MTSAKILLVEGNDDQHVIWSLLKYNNFPECFRVEEKGGIDRLLSTFPVQVKGSEMKSVGIVIDADLDLSTRWNSVKHDLHRMGYINCPNNLPEDGLVLEQADMPRVGVWVMPNNITNGMLEDFVAYLVPSGDALWSHGQDVLNAIPEGIVEFSSNHFAKAHIHTWLAWKSDPGTPMGLAITKKYLDAGSPTTVPFLSWLERLFVQ